MNFGRFATASMFLLVGVCLPLSVGNAQETKHQTKFLIKFGGLKVGSATFNFQFDQSNYALNGNGKTAGLAEWFSDAKGSIESNGNFSGGLLNPLLHKAVVTEKKKKPESLKMTFTDNRVKDVQIKTNKKLKNRVAPKYVPIEAHHKAQVIDPASTLIVRVKHEDAGSGRKVCNQRFPVYDGETRYDMTLGYKGTQKIETKGYSGYAYVCKLRYVPIAGHKKSHKTVKEMAANKRMEIWLAPMSGEPVFSPIKIVVGTKYGRVDALPLYFGLPAGG